MKDKILRLLKENNDHFLSGQGISDNLGVSRTAIWKYINSLKEEGYVINSSSKKGYQLISCPDLLTADEIGDKLHTKFIGKEIVHFQSIDSTNNKAKELAAKNTSQGTVVIAEEQTLGRGRLGRNWTSPKYKGIWLSIILKPDTNPMKVPKITQIGAAAVIESLKSLKIDAEVKWPNDIVIKGKKVCGILTEMSGELNRVNYVVMGLGINANLQKNDFPENIIDKATSLSIESNSNIDRKTLVSTLLFKFEELYEEFDKEGIIKTSVDICRKNSAIIGKDIKIINREQETFAKALDIDDNGELIVQYKDGSIEKLISGEISIRALNGYI